MKFAVRPATLAQANALVASIHRHHKPVTGHRFSLALYDEETGRLLGVAICGRPVARMADTYGTLEVLRCATDGTPNAISKLYGSIARIADASGFAAVQTYTLPEEGGASMRASGFELDGTTTGGEWTRPGRTAAAASFPTTPKSRWVKRFPKNQWTPPDRH